MVAELETQVRRVFLDGRDHPEDFFPTTVGHSIGTWEGDALVIDTTLLEAWELRPWPRSDQAHIVERMHLTALDQVGARPTGFVAQLDLAINDDVLVVDITLTDPVYYDGPQRRIAYYQARCGQRHGRVWPCQRALARPTRNATDRIVSRAAGRHVPRVRPNRTCPRLIHSAST